VHTLTPDTADWLVELRDTLRATPLELELQGVEEHRRLRDELVAQIDDYLLPRLAHLEAPLLAVLGGSTGSGKSTLLNSLVGEKVSRTGVLRPTTRSPVLVCHPDELRWFSDDRVLPGLSRVTGDGSAAGQALVLKPVSDLPRGIALLDSPDIDSVEESNRTLAAQLLAAADLWLFVTTAARYADAVPWEFLEQARERSTALALVLNRVPAGASSEVTRHLTGMLDQWGLDGTRIFTVEEVELADDGLPAETVAPIRDWFDDLAADTETRAAVIRQTLEGALATLHPRVDEVARSRDAQVEVAALLDDSATRAYRRALASIDEGLKTGSLLRGEVLDRWQDLVGSGEFMRSLQSSIGRIRDRLASLITGRDTTEAEVRGEIESSVGRLIVSEAEQAALGATEAWEETSAGRGLLGDEARALSRASGDLHRQVEVELRDWQRDVLDLVRDAGQEKRVTARALSLGINTIGVALMIVAFAHTGGLTGLEVGVAGGTATVSQALLTAIFGEQAVRSLATQARRLLLARVSGLLDQEASRFHRRVEEARGETGFADGLRALSGADT
jgi:energy-coupling factor transporter ATP-binding protein EcfA2